MYFLLLSYGLRPFLESSGSFKLIGLTLEGNSDFITSFLSGFASFKLPRFVVLCVDVLLLVDSTMTWVWFGAVDVKLVALKSLIGAVGFDCVNRLLLLRISFSRLEALVWVPSFFNTLLEGLMPLRVVSYLNFCLTVCLVDCLTFARLAFITVFGSGLLCAFEFDMNDDWLVLSFDSSWLLACPWSAD